MPHSQYSAFRGLPEARRSASRTVALPSSPANVSAGSTQGPDDGGPDGLIDYARMIWRRKWLLLATTVLFGSAAWLLCRSQVPVYQARLSLEVMAPSLNQFRLRDANSPAAPDTGLDAYVQTQVEVLQDESMVRRVAKRLELERHPQFAPRRSRFAVVRHWIGMPQESATTSNRQVVGRMRESLRVRPLGQTRIIRITFDSPDPVLAANVLNTLAAEYVAYLVQVGGQSTQDLSDWLAGQLNGLKSNLENSESNLQQYAERTGLMYTREKESVAEDRLRQLQ